MLKKTPTMAFQLDFILRIWEMLLRMPMKNAIVPHLKHA